MAVKREACDNWFSKCVRHRDQHRCQYCFNEGTDCAHIYGRAKKSVRWSMDNAVTLCRYHHQWFGSNPVAFTDWLTKIYGSGHMDILREKASADEVAGAISQQNEGQASEYLLKQMEAFRSHYNEVCELKDYIGAYTKIDSDTHQDPTFIRQAADIWLDLSNEVKEALWVAPSKGGVFTTEERTFLKSDEFAQARKEAA